MSQDDNPSNNVVALFDQAGAGAALPPREAAEEPDDRDLRPDDDIAAVEPTRGVKPRAKKTGKKGVDGPVTGGNDHEPPTPKPLGFSVDWMNDRYALVLMGSKAVVTWQQPDAPVEDRLRILSIDAFSAYFANKFTQVYGADGNIRTISWANRWLHHKERRTYGGIEFYPDPDDAPHLPGYLNLWRGFSVLPQTGAGSYVIFRDHLLTNVCRGSETHFRYVFGWFAHMVQRPRERIGTSLIFKGKMGTGKSKIGEVFGSIIENHYFLVDDPRYITGQFNAHMASCLLLQAEEAVWAGDKKAEGRLKSLITSNIQMIESKGIDPIRVANFVRLIMTSNEDWVVPAGMDERRFAVFDVADTVKGNYDYFREMDEQLEAGGRAALLADLLDFDLTGIELRDIPKTDALLEQKIMSLGSVERWWFERLRAGTVTRKHADWESIVVKEEVATDYIDDSDRIGIKRRASETEMGMKLKRLVPGLRDFRPWRVQEDGMSRRKRCWEFGELALCRQAFAEILQQEIIWPDAGDDPGSGGTRETGEAGYDGF